MSSYRTSYYYEVLDKYKIGATSIRVAVLRAIYSFESEFTTDQVLDELKEDIPDIKRNTVVSVLRLYKLRGLLTSSEYPTDRLARKPIIKFKVKTAQE